ncbi:MAG: pyruvate kinase [Granulosicoccus sp.]|nr:pyruvate kinase [Granulosicoccus sp.]
MTCGEFSPDQETNWSDNTIITLLDELTDLQTRMRQMENQFADRIQDVAESNKLSARNLLHYVSLRQHDLRSLQEQLSSRGLSSLGRCEAHVMTTLCRVIDVLCRLSGQSNPCSVGPLDPDFSHGRQLLDLSTSKLFGAEPAAAAHIMVTSPSEAAEDPSIIANMLASGIDCLRINCAHDGPDTWRRMIDNLRMACEQQGKSCRIAMDLGGPKLRTGAIAASERVLKWRPERDTLGRVLSPARLWIHAEGSISEPPESADKAVPVIADWFCDLTEGDELRFLDARGRKRKLSILDRAAGGYWAETDRTSYVTPETRLMLHTDRYTDSKVGRIGTVPRKEQFITLNDGDKLLLGMHDLIGRPATYADDGRQLELPMIGCTLPSVIQDLKPGERVIFDDGKITTHVLSCGDTSVELEVINAGEKGAKLRADKGINLPDTDLQLDSLTDKDLEDLDFIVQRADMVNYSFIRRADDVTKLQIELARRGRPDMPIVLKIENRQAFEHLPSLLLAAMRSDVSGVMIARGDLAVEMGWERLAEVQEEILWMCEAAHQPAIWATQVLENLAKSGIPSRAEITDAAMSVRAECVMLNKGPYVLETVRTLSDILHRMRDHQAKKRPLLRRLRLADDLVPDETAPIS